MAVSFAHLTTGSDTTNGTSYATASIAPSANRILYLAVFATAPSGQTTVAPTISGIAGLTWELVRQAPSTDAIRTLYWFRCSTGGSAPTPGTLTINFGAQSLTGAMWMVYEAAGADMSGTNGSGATVQSVEERRTGGANTSVSFAFSNTVNPANGTLACVGILLATTITPGAGWTTVGGTTTYSAPNQGFMAMHSNSAVQTVAASWSGGTNTWTIGIEVKAAAATGVTGDGALAATAATLSGSGTVTAPEPGTVTGDGALAATAATATGAGALALSGTGTISATAATATGDGAVLEPVTGTGSITAPAATATGDGAVLEPVTGTGSITAPAATVSGSGEGAIVPSAGPDQTLVVEPDLRVLVVEVESRVFVVSADPRTLTVEPDPHSFIVFEESRCLTVP